ncbi:RNA-directed DNA polymerase from mobile element jockey [Astathelohania contejeani]|uniref:RNA-directed DNA polymerase from mobile element jockey n=1 Tax=Astathelohania contejeani TaxID=164912 RepID=A0ABQ7HVB8_9MICR|nr:RNA-directed DNA polymerase from mobile element jockey [Thelohania contejeani]
MTHLTPHHPITRPITLREMRDILMGTRNKAPGLSGIRAVQLKILPNNYLQSLLNVYNTILASGHVPGVFKTAKIICLPKPGKDRTVPGNYRPISLLEKTGKCFEKIISNRINYYMEFHHLYRKNNSASGPTGRPSMLLTFTMQQLAHVPKTK